MRQGREERDDPLPAPAHEVHQLPATDLADEVFQHQVRFAAGEPLAFRHRWTPLRRSRRSRLSGGPAVDRADSRPPQPKTGRSLSPRRQGRTSILRLSAPLMPAGPYWTVRSVYSLVVV